MSAGPVPPEGSIGDLLFCPSCRQGFRSAVPSILECRCRAVPVLGGIPVLLEDPFVGEALEDLRECRFYREEAWSGGPPADPVAPEAIPSDQPFVVVAGPRRP